MQLRSLALGSALLITGSIVGVTTQHFASADIGSGDRPVLVPITPCRLVDTRPAPATVGPRSTPLGPADTLTVDVQEPGTACVGMIPTDASAVALNMTALKATTLTFLTVWPGGDRPDASSLNPSPGEPPTPNAVTTKLSVDQTFEVYNDVGSLDLVVDVTGYYVDHHHDDRYYRKDETYSSGETYTKGEIDDAIESAQPKMIQLPVTSASLGTNASFFRSATRAGIRVPNDTTNASFLFSFVLPPDYTPDTPFEIEFLWSVDEPACTVTWARAGSTITREGEVRRSGGIDDSNHFDQSAGDAIVNRAVFPWTPEDWGTRPGDAISVAFYRWEGDDTCTGNAHVHGASVHYT